MTNNAAVISHFRLKVVKKTGERECIIEYIQCTEVFWCMCCTLGSTEESKLQMPLGGKSNEALCLTSLETSLVCRHFWKTRSSEDEGTRRSLTSYEDSGRSRRRDL